MFFDGAFAFEIFLFSRSLFTPSLQENTLTFLYL